MPVHSTYRCLQGLTNNSEIWRSHIIYCRGGILFDQEYIELKSIFTKEELHQLAEAMWSASNRRLFLLQLKAKYAGNLNLGGWGTIIVISLYYFRWTENCQEAGGSNSM